MRDVKRRLCSFSFYDQQAIQETLEDMAAKGWMLEKTGNLAWTYKKAEPRTLRFSVTYFPSASDFDPGPTDGALTKIDYCRQDGWVLAASWGPMQIFYNENEDAVPIETEPAAQVENIRRSMRKNVLIPQAVLCLMLLLNLALKIDQLRKYPVENLSDPFYFYSFLLFGGLFLACLYEIAFCFWWSKKAAAAAERDGVFLPIKTRPVASLILIVLSALLGVLSFGALSTSVLGFVLLCLCAELFIAAVGNLIKAQLKKKGVSRNFNRAISVGSILVLTLLFLGAMTASIISGNLPFASGKTVVGTYELYGRTREIYDDPLPLELEDLADVSAQWSKESDHKETVLLSSTEYRQYAVPVDGNDTAGEYQLEYTITEVKWGFLYDFVKQSLLNARQDEVFEDFVFIDHYEPADASIWNADSAYQLHWSDGVLDTYLIFWGNNVAEIKFYWTPTPEQIAIAAGKIEGAVAGVS